MKLLILNTLKTRFAGVDEKVLNRIAEKLAKTVTKEDDVQAAVDAVTFQQVIDGEADRRATEATQTAVTNYEKKYSIKEGKPVTTGGGQETQTEPNNGKDGNGETPAWAKALIESNKALGDKLAALEGEKVITTRKQQLNVVLGSASDKFKGRVEKNFDRMNFKDEEDFNTWLAEVKTEAEEDSTETTAQGAVFGFPKVGQSKKGDEVPKQIQDYLDGKAKAEGQAF
jgi:hypothetical protein